MLPQLFFKTINVKQTSLMRWTQTPSHQVCNHGITASLVNKRLAQDVVLAKGTKMFPKETHTKSRTASTSISIYSYHFHRGTQPASTCHQKVKMSTKSTYSRLFNDELHLPFLSLLSSLTYKTQQLGSLYRKSTGMGSAWLLSCLSLTTVVTLFMSLI